MSTLYSSKVADIKDNLNDIISLTNDIYENNNIDIDSLKADYRNDDSIIFFASMDDDYAVALSDATYAKFATYVQAGLLSMKETGEGKFNKLLAHKVSLLKDIDDKGINRYLDTISETVKKMTKDLREEAKKEEEAEETRVKILETTKDETEKVDEVSDPEPKVEGPKKKLSFSEGLDKFFSTNFKKVKITGVENPVFDEYGNYLGDNTINDSNEIFTVDFIDDLFMSSMKCIKENSQHADVIDVVDDDIIELYQNVTKSKIGSLILKQACVLLNEFVPNIKDANKVQSVVDKLLSFGNATEEEKKKAASKIMPFIKMLRFVNINQDLIKEVVVNTIVKGSINKIDESIDKCDDIDEVINMIATMKQEITDYINNIGIKDLAEIKDALKKVTSIRFRFNSPVAADKEADDDKKNIASFVKGKISKLFNSNKEEIVEDDDFDTASKFIPQDEKKDAINFGGIKPLLDNDKMTINASDKEAESKTKSLIKTVNRISNRISELLDKEIYDFTLTPMDNGTMNLVTVNKNTQVPYTFIIDPGVVIGRGVFIFYQGVNDNNPIHIPLQEKSIVKRFLNNPNGFVPTEEERKTCESYLFEFKHLYDLIDLKGTKADIKNVIRTLANEKYQKLGKNLEDLYNKALLPEVGMQVRTRFIEFKDEDHFTLSSDNNVKNVMNIGIGLTKEPTKIIYDNGKVTININDGEVIKEYQI